MPNYQLTYFDMDGGRANPIRIAFHAASIEFEDVRISFSEFMQARAGYRFNCVPVLRIDDVVVTQSNALCRYVGKLANLYPEDDLQAMYCDEAMGAIEDLLHHIVHTLGLEGDELKAAREKLADGWIKVILKGLDELLERGGDYFADNRLTVADLKVVAITESLISGQFEHIPADIVERVAPRLVAHAERVSQDPIVTSSYAARTQ